ncbi:MAG: hypothetical protein KGI38_12580 [Thaumarchaeota archaeon]|nr:hypothetical protein [Nitrososphaerota archaeon]
MFFLLVQRLPDGMGGVGWGGLFGGVGAVLSVALIRGRKEPEPDSVETSLKEPEPPITRTKDNSGKAAELTDQIPRPQASREPDFTSQLDKRTIPVSIEVILEGELPLSALTQLSIKTKRITVEKPQTEKEKQAEPEPEPNPLTELTT